MGKKYVGFWLILLMVLSFNTHGEWFRFSGTAMTTPIELVFWSEDEGTAARAQAAVFAEFDRVDQQMTRYSEDSELSLVNRQAAQEPVTVSQGLFAVLAKAQQVSRWSDGAFDISFGSVGYLYDYRAGEQPSGEQLAQRLEFINYRDIVLDESEQSVAFRKPGLKLDLGGIAKGYAVDRGIAILQEHGIHHAHLSAGGDLRFLGDKRGRPWVVGIRDPRSEDRNALVLPVADVAMSTSGDYERYFVDDSGERVHHILSPSTGRPAQGIQSATVMGNDSLTVDGVSTAVFVLGVEKGLAMVDRLPGIDVIIIDEQRRVHYSQGLMPADPTP